MNNCNIELEITNSVDMITQNTLENITQEITMENIFDENNKKMNDNLIKLVSFFLESNSYNNSIIYTNFHFYLEKIIITHLKSILPNFNLMKINDKSLKIKLDFLIKDLYVKLTNCNNLLINYDEMYLLHNIVENRYIKNKNEINFYITKHIILLSNKSNLQKLYIDMMSEILKIY
jgi:hypothetical protein